MKSHPIFRLNEEILYSIVIYMEYKCELCNYLTHDKFNHDRHVKTKKHTEKVLEQNAESLKNSCKLPVKLITHNCQFCNNSYSTASNARKA